jgi:hypothetical protein
MNKEVDFKQNFSFYRSKISCQKILGRSLVLLIGSGPDQLSAQASGLYVFRPLNNDPIKPIDIKHFYCYKVKIKSILFNTNRY